MKVTTNTKSTNKDYFRKEFNGFPRISEVPENLQPLFQRLRKLNQNITVSFAKKDNLISLTINYTSLFTLNAIQVLEKLLNNTLVLNNYKLLEFKHSDYTNTYIVFKTINKA